MTNGFVELASNYAVNAFNSTLSFLKKGISGYEGIYQAGKYGRQLGMKKGLTGKALGTFTGEQMYGAGRGFLRNTGFKGGAAMGTIALGGAIGAGGAADFLNPWGFGWGD